MSPNLSTLKPSWPACIGALLIAASLGAHAKELLYVSAGTDHLSKGYDSWANFQTGYAYQGPRGSAAIQVEEQWRFKRQDTALMATGASPVGDSWAVLGEAYVSTGNFLAGRGASLGLSKALLAPSVSATVVIDSGLRWRGYEAFDQVSWSSGVTAYLPGWTALYRLALDVSGAQLDSLYSHQVTLTRDFDDDHALTVGLAAGRERNMDLGVALAPQMVRAVSLTGRVRLRDRLSLRPAFAVTQQGDAYTRKTLQVGLQYAF